MRCTRRRELGYAGPLSSNLQGLTYALAMGMNRVYADWQPARRAILSIRASMEGALLDQLVSCRRPIAFLTNALLGSRDCEPRLASRRRQMAVDVYSRGLQIDTRYLSSSLNNGLNIVDACLHEAAQIQPFR